MKLICTHLWNDDLLDILATDCESTLINETQSAGKGSYTETGACITYDSKQSILEVKDCTSANNLEIIFVSTLTVNDAKAKNQDKEGISDEQKEAGNQEKCERSTDFDARTRIRRQSSVCLEPPN